MEILSHRGYWLTPKEKNQKEAFQRSFQAGFGVETDLRDLNGRIVVSHDLPKGDELSLEAFLELYCQFRKPGTLALNIKSDGLQEILRKNLDLFDIQRYFLFDMSVPDLLRSTQAGLRSFTRESEYEQEPLSLYTLAQGVWMDCFKTDWIDEKAVSRHLEADKLVCLVSPELHRRAHLPVWEMYRSWSIHSNNRLMLCTDFPEQAREYFSV